MPNINICTWTKTLGINDYPILDENNKLVTWADAIIPNCNYILDKNVPA